MGRKGPGLLSVTLGCVNTDQFSHSVMSDSLQLHGLQHTRFPSPSPTPGACSNKLMSIKSVMPSNYLILCCPLILLPSIFPNIRVFSNESALRIRWPKYWSFGFDISPSSEHLGPQLKWYSYLSRHEGTRGEEWCILGRKHL